MLKKNKLMLIRFFISFVISFSIPAIALSDCGKFKTRWIESQKTIEKTENICVKENIASSKDCTPLVQKGCPFRTLKKTKPLEESIRPIGSPGFNLCHSIDGSPQMYEIQIGKEWKNFERCFWKNSKSFIEIDELISFYKTL